MAIATTNDKLRFLHGLQENLPKNAAGEAQISNGTIYVTTDERAMYVDINNQRIRLGDFQVFDTFDSIPTNPTPSTSALVYAADKNILCRYDGSKWVQINSQRTLAQLLATVTTAYSASNNVATATHTFKDNAGSAATAKPQIKIGSGNANTATVTADSSNGIVIKTANTDTVTAASTTFDASSNAAVIQLTETTTGYDVNGAAVNTSKDGATITIAGGDGTTVVDKNGTISIKTAPSTLKTSFDANGKLIVEAAYSDGKTVDNKLSASTPTIKVGSDTYSFANGVANLTGVYTSQEVDDKIEAQLKTAQAMVFKGTVSSSATLPDTAAHGEVWVVSEAALIRNAANTYSQQAVVGDFFIAGFKTADAKEDETTGLIAAKDLQWQYIPAGNDDELSTVVSTDTNKLTISTQLGSAAAKALGSVIVGNGLSATVGTSGTAKTLTIAHPAAAADAKTGTSGSTSSTRTIQAIKTLTVDDYGHIASYETHTYTVPNEAVSAVANTVGGSDNAVTVTTKVTHSSGANKEGSFTIGTSGNSAVKVYRESDSTSKVSIELCWGSF